MCGICGILNYKENGVNEETLRAMCSRLKHRGPDDEGTYIRQTSPSLGLGHRRLSIIDLSSAGHQPMSNEDKTIYIVLNGEIYNYQDLRAELIKKGHRFKSNTDTEAVIHLYEEYKEDCVKHLRGMFAFAIWDEKLGVLLLARDRFGKKPLLYYYKANKFCFASEFSAILASNLIDREINLEAIGYYLTYGYIPAPLTIYKDVLKLPPASMLILKNNKMSLKKYWQLDYSRKIKISEEEAVEETLRLLKEAVKIRLYSDVPLGAFLSGGIDSSTVVALMSELLGKKVKTFSIGFEEKAFDELRYARNIVTKFATDHNEFIVKPDALKILPLLVERYGEPYADSSCIPTYYVAQQTRQFVTVALNGDGGDEMFAGYERYRAAYLSELCIKLPLFLRKGMVSFLENIIPENSNSRLKISRLKRFLKGTVLSLPDRYLRWVAIFTRESQDCLYSETFREKVLGTHPEELVGKYFNNLGNYNLIDTLLYTDVNTYLPDDLLVKMDIVTMANSLEGRSPFLDHHLAEFVASLPADFKMRRLTKKYILKRVIKDLVPRENSHRPKMGFGVPIGNWFRHELKGFLLDVLLSPKSLGRGYFKPEVVKHLVKQHIEKKADFSQQLWSLLMLELWHGRFIDQNA